MTVDYRSMVKARAEAKKAESAERDRDFAPREFGFVSIEDGEKRRVRFLNTVGTLPIISAHQYFENNKKTMFLCMGQFDLPCSHCDTGHDPRDFWTWFLFDYESVGKKYVSAKSGKEGIENPLKPWVRGGGKGGVEHEVFMDLDSPESAEDEPDPKKRFTGINCADCFITRSGVSKLTTYFYKMDRKVAPFKVPDGLTETQAKLLVDLLKAVKDKNLTFLYEKAMRNFELPKGVKDWPDASTHVIITDTRD